MCQNIICCFSFSILASMEQHQKIHFYFLITIFSIAFVKMADNYEQLPRPARSVFDQVLRKPENLSNCKQDGLTGKCVEVKNSDQMPEFTQDQLVQTLREVTKQTHFSQKRKPKNRKRNKSSARQPQ